MFLLNKVKSNSNFLLLFIFTLIFSFEALHAKSSKEVMNQSRGECSEGYVSDCSGDGDCCPETWLGDGIEDDSSQPFGCDLSCHECDG